MKDLTNLRKIAEEATPGPWEPYDANEGMDRAYLPMWCVANEEFHNPTTGDDEDWMGVEIHVGDKADSDHIATFDPPTVLALLARLEQAEQERKNFSDACKTLAQVLAKHSDWVVEATDSQDIIGEDGDGDWDVVWDRVTELGESKREAEAAVARVREVATGDPTEYGWSEAMLAVLRALDGEQK